MGFVHLQHGAYACSKKVHSVGNRTAYEKTTMPYKRTAETEPQTNNTCNAVLAAVALKQPDLDLDLDL